ncbi:MAG: hypothetical protein RSC38_06275 [Oscillospiraceae bacterium]
MEKSATPSAPVVSYSRVPIMVFVPVPPPISPAANFSRVRL